MNREEAILNAAEIANILEKRGLNGAANSLMESLKVLCTPRNPWVKTSDRLPTENDADGFGYVLAWCSCVGGMEITAREVMESPNAYPYWMPIPSLPEVENEL